MKYIDRYNADSNSFFWDEFSLFKGKEPFRDLFKKDRSKDKHKTSKFMWLLVMCYDLDSEVYAIMDEQDRLTTAEEIVNITAKEVVGDEFFMYATAFTDFIDTVLSADVRAKEDKLKERAKFISETKYTLDGFELNEETGKYVKIAGNAKDLDTMIANTSKIHDEVRMMRAKLKEEDRGSGKGGSTESFIENIS